MRKRLLFVAEDITLAQVVRLVALARSLDPQRYEVHFASATFSPLVFAGTAFQQWPLETLDRNKAMKAVARGQRLYDERTLARYVDADRAVIKAVRPDLVVGDLRWSLAVSAPLEGVRHVGVINGYWSPFAIRDGFPLPEHPIVKLLGESTAARYFPRALPRVFQHFAAPLNRLRERHGLPPVGSLLEVLTHADDTLYLDPPELIPTQGLPESHRFLGPVLWAPRGDLPSEWGKEPDRRPPVYVTLGSSGMTKSLATIVSALCDLGLDVLVATASRFAREGLPAAAIVRDMVPGDLACARAAFVVSNGGSTTGYQALAAGKPVLGIPFNLDQYLASEVIERAHAGQHVRAGRVDAAGIKAAARRLLDDGTFAEGAEAVSKLFTRHDALRAFGAFVDHALTGTLDPRAAQAPP